MVIVVCGHARASRGISPVWSWARLPESMERGRPKGKGRGFHACSVQLYADAGDRMGAVMAQVRG